MKVVIAGGTGFLGLALVRHFMSQGHEVTVLTRRPHSKNQIQWDGENHGPWEVCLEGADVLINLAGKSVNCRYNAANEQEIYDSRLKSTSILGKAVANCANPPKLWVNSSTATIYRHAEDRRMDEETGELGTGFSVDVAQKWEKTFFESSPCACRRVALRSSMVMGHAKNSALTHFMTVVKLGLGGPEGSGNQMVSWIHIADWLAAVDWVIEHPELEGVVNVTSPNPVANREFLQTLREVLGVKIALPMPAWLLEIGAFFLRTETELILKSRWVVPKRLLNSGFKFQFPEWKSAATDLVCKQKNPSPNPLPSASHR